MSDLKIQYAYKDDKLYNVNDAEIITGDKCYWVDGFEKYEVYPAKGEKQRPHFRCMPGVVIDANRAFHKDCQYYLQETKQLHFEDCIIEATEVLLEHEAAYRIKKDIPNYSMIPDCLFLDDNGDILCIVEVFYTHKKSEEDIKKINQYGIITFELTYENDHKKPTETFFLYRGIECRVKRAQAYIQEQLKEIDGFATRIIEARSRKQKLWEEKHEIEGNIYKYL
jgi:hypothetical protein